jgi:hypothetical protein
MKPTLRLWLSGLALSLSTFAAQAAVSIDGITFQDTAQVAGQTLQLNGAGKRVRIIVDVYAMGLYVPKVDSSASALIPGAGPRSARIVLMRDLTGADFAEAMAKGIEQNHSSADLAKLQARLDELGTAMKAFGQLRKGTVVQMNQVPGTGLQVIVNGETKIKGIPGDDFYAALMRIWLGDKPADKDLKKALLSNR